MNRPLFCLMLALLAAPCARSEKVANGNDVARWFAEGDAARRAEVQKEGEGGIHSFRFLEIKDIRPAAEGSTARVLDTVEPGSGLKVVLHVSSSLSLKTVETLKTGDAVAAQGRIEDLGRADAATLVVKPAQIRYKDRAAPKAGKELLNEVDPRATK
jgi:hypothetical protein